MLGPQGQPPPRCWQVSLSVGQHRCACSLLLDELVSAHFIHLDSKRFLKCWYQFSFLKESISQQMLQECEGIHVATCLTVFNKFRTGSVADSS